MIVIRLLFVAGLIVFAGYEIAQFVKLCKEKKKDKIQDNKEK